jgi:hypothetical protein
MKVKTFATSFGFVAAALFATPALATLSLTSGNATYATTVGTTSAGAGGGLADLRPEGGATTDHLFRNTWHWRINGVDTREFMFSSEAGFGFAEAGGGTAQGTQSWTGLDAGRFNAVLQHTLTDSGAAGAATVTQRMSITNTSGAPLSMALYNFCDFDILGTFGGDSASLFAPDTINISEGPQFIRHAGLGAANYGVTAFNTLFTTLTNGAIDNLANTGLPFGPGDYTGAWQWNNLNIGIGETVMFTSVIAVNQPIPAPSALALLGLAGLAQRRRRA